MSAQKNSIPNKTKIIIETVPMTFDDILQSWAEVSFLMADERLVLFKNSSFRLLSMASSVVWFTSLHTQTQGAIAVDGGRSETCEQFTLLEGELLAANVHELHPGTSRQVSQLLRKQTLIDVSTEYALQAGSFSHSDLHKLSLPVKFLYGDTASL